MTKKNKAEKKIESNEEFLARISKINKDAQKKIKKEMELDPKEIEEYKEKGKEIGKIYEELEECEKISAEFKINPPIVITKHINGISIKYEYDEKFKDKIKLLKKHCISFISATKDTSIFSSNFKASGKAYVKRMGRKILLPESSIPPCVKEFGMGSRVLDPKNSGFILEDGDIIGTENDSYVRINDFISNEDYRREIFIYPNSEVVLNLNKQETHPAPAFMDPSKVPEIIKKNSSRTLIEYKINNFLLNEGIFKINILDKNKNANRILKLPSECPEIEFLHSSKTIENIIDKTMAKMAPNVAAIYNAKVSKARSSKICDEISTFIELCKDNSIVIFGTMNSVKNKNSGKMASVILPKAASRDFVVPGKITVIGNQIYSDASEVIDPRVKAIIKNNMAFEQYAAIMEGKQEFEQKLKDFNDKKSKPKIPESSASKKEKEKRRSELLDELTYLKGAGDSEMADAVQMQINELDAPKEDSNFNEEYIIKMLRWYDKEIIRLKPDLDTNFPSYNPPNERDLSK